MPESVQLRDVLVILLAAVVVVSVFHRLRASAVLGYLVAGALIGPHSLGLVRDVGATAIVGQFGVVFLLFSIGLELSIERLVALREASSVSFSFLSPSRQEPSQPTPHNSRCWSWASAWLSHRFS